MTYTPNMPTGQGAIANQQFLRQLSDALPQPAPAQAKPKALPQTPAADYEHPLLLKQSNFWSRAILWGLLGTTVAGVAWANAAEMEEAVQAQGKLEPQGTVKDVKAPNPGVVKAIYVKEGQRVKKGDKLMKLDPTTLTAQMESLKQVKQMLEREAEYYRLQLQGYTSAAAPARVPQSIVALTRSRAALQGENQYLRAQLTGDVAGLSLDQQARLRYNQVDLETRSAAIELKKAQLNKQMQQTETRRAAAQQTLAMNTEILDRITPLAEQGAISRIQFLKQQQEVMNGSSQVEQLLQEQQRIQLEVAETQTKVENTVASDGKDVMALLSINEQKLAEIDSQFNKAALENEKKIAEIVSQIQQTQQMLRYSDVVAPADGAVFEMKPTAPGYVANPAEPLLKIVPQEALVAKVTISNQDIGFVKPGMEVDVRVDSFPFSEFGDIKGELIAIGSDAMPPTPEKPFYSFPAKVRLKQQTVMVRGREVKLHSGMSLSVNVKTRKRKVMDVFTEQFMRGTEGLKFLR